VLTKSRGKKVNMFKLFFTGKALFLHYVCLVHSIKIADGQKGELKFNRNIKRKKKFFHKGACDIRNWEFNIEKGW